MKVLIRADGGEKIGLGHIMRTLTLAKELLNEFEVKYICISENKYVKGREIVKSENIEVIEINERNELDSIKNLDGDIIVVDKYGINKEYLNSLREKFKVLYIDDNNELDYYPVDILINQNPHSKFFNYNVRKSTKVLCGGMYTILRDEFLKCYPIEIRKDIKDVLITLGGSDDLNITDELIRELKGLKINLHVIIGPAFKFKDNIKNYNRDNVFLHENVNMSEVMKKVDLAISSCGSTLYELSYLGIPTFGIIVADNQKLCGQFMESLGCIYLKKHIRKEHILNITYSERLIMSSRMKNLIDGKGKYRIKEFLKLYDK
ncbi:UDP-2,4-diacetamido-2,4,6-trideoxy-beta-L-altropyranose hydrolase [Clostridium sp. Marseille-QA1073]